MEKILKINQYCQIIVAKLAIYCNEKKESAKDVGKTRCKEYCIFFCKFAGHPNTLLMI